MRLADELKNRATNAAAVMSTRAFITERSAGAAKIAVEARKKGGLALLTAVHFEAKAPAYKQCLRLCTTSNTSQCVLALHKLENVAATEAAAASTMTAFQAATGKHEVFGEVALFLTAGI